jgi:hypothetical protein
MEHINLLKTLADEVNRKKEIKALEDIEIAKIKEDVLNKKAEEQLAIIIDSIYNVCEKDALEGKYESMLFTSSEDDELSVAILNKLIIKFTELSISYYTESDEPDDTDILSVVTIQKPITTNLYIKFDKLL